MSSALERLRQGTRKNDDLPLFDYSAHDDKLSSSATTSPQPKTKKAKPDAYFYNPEKKELWEQRDGVWRRVRSFKIPRDGIPEGLVREPRDVRMNAEGDLEGLYDGEWKRIRP